MRKIIEQLIDDIDGSEAVETVSFALDGMSFEIDLSEANATELRGVLADFVAKARRTGGRAVRGRGAASVAPARGNQARHRARMRLVREWARVNGFTLSARGRIPVKVLEAYENRNAEKKVIMNEKVAAKSSPNGGTVTPFRAAAAAEPKVSRTRSTSRRSRPDSVKD